MRLVWGRVATIDRESDGAQHLTIQLDDGASGRAVNYPSLAGGCEVGDRVLVNTTAVDLALGTGGLHYVVARQGAGEGVVLDDPSGGHVMKLRYSPLQRDVVSVESPESPHHEAMRTAERIDGVPVVCCGLHSQMPLVAAAVKQARPASRVAYCMTDQAALPIALSDLARSALDAGLIDETITCGQAFGGHLEAVNLHSGLLAARHVAGADVIVVAIGPGVVGTATPFGHGGVAHGEAINAVAALGATPVACLRVSFADSRERHRVVSHHTLSALTRIALAGALVAVPSLEEPLAGELEAALEAAGVWSRHRRVDVRDVTTLLPDMRGLQVTTMGRRFEDDPGFFLAAYAAGDVAARFIGHGVTDNP